MTTAELALWFSQGWTLAVLAIPLLWIPQALSGNVPWHKLRTWASLLLASLVAWAVTPAIGNTPFAEYLLICVIGTGIVITRPAGSAQYAIGFLFLMMAGQNLGAIMSGVAHNPIGYQVNIAIGWMQAGILFGWSATDGGKAILASRFFERHRLIRGAIYGRAR